MGAYAGPDVSENGLVLALDAGNIFKSIDSTSNNFLQNGSFAGGLGVTYEQGSNPTNTIVELENPGDSNYVLQQNGSNTEYQMNIDGGAQGALSANTQYVMSGWYAKSSDYNGGDTMFHARAYSTGGSHIATGNGIGTLLYSVEIGGLTWEYRYQTISTPSDYSGNFDWYMGYGTTNTTGYRYYTGLKVEEGSFPSLLDLSRNGNDAKIINGTSYSSANGGSLVFDGTNDFIDLTNKSVAVSGNGARSIFCWVKSTTGGRCIVSTGTANNSQAFNLVTYGSSKVGVMGYNYDFYPTTGANIFDGNWHFVGATYNGAGTLITYVDGIQDNISTGRTYSTTGQNNFIGKSNHVGSEAYWNGNIAQVSIYNRALTASEVQQNYNATKSRFGL